MIKDLIRQLEESTRDESSDAHKYAALANLAASELLGPGEHFSPLATTISATLGEIGAQEQTHRKMILGMLHAIQEEGPERFK